MKLNLAQTQGLVDAIGATKDVSKQNLWKVLETYMAKEFDIKTNQLPVFMAAVEEHLKDLKMEQGVKTKIASMFTKRALMDSELRKSLNVEELNRLVSSSLTTSETLDKVLALDAAIDLPTWQQEVGVMFIADEVANEVENQEGEFYKFFRDFVRPQEDIVETFKDGCALLGKEPASFIDENIIEALTEMNVKFDKAAAGSNYHLSDLWDDSEKAVFHYGMQAVGHGVGIADDQDDVELLTSKGIDVKKIKGSFLYNPGNDAAYTFLTEYAAAKGAEDDSAESSLNAPITSSGKLTLYYVWHKEKAQDEWTKGGGMMTVMSDEDLKKFKEDVSKKAKKRGWSDFQVLPEGKSPVKASVIAEILASSADWSNMSDKELEENLIAALKMAQQGSSEEMKKLDLQQASEIKKELKKRGINWLNVVKGKIPVKSHITGASVITQILADAKLDELEQAREANPYKNQKHIAVTYQIVTEESAKQGDFADHGYEDFLDCTPDQYDIEEGLTAVDLAVKEIKNAGGSQPSSSQFHTGVWYSNPDPDIDMYTGEEKSLSYHIENFTPEEEKQVWEKLMNKKAESSILAQFLEFPVLTEILACGDDCDSCACSEGTADVATSAKAKDFSGLVDKVYYMFRVEGIDVAALTGSLPEQLEQLKKLKNFKSNASRDYIRAKGKDPKKAVKEWVAEFKPSQYLVSWFNHQKDDTLDVFYTGNDSFASLDGEGKMVGIFKQKHGFPGVETSDGKWFSFSEQEVNNYHTSGDQEYKKLKFHINENDEATEIEHLVESSGGPLSPDGLTTSARMRVMDYEADPKKGLTFTLDKAALEQNLGEPYNKEENHEEALKEIDRALEQFIGNSSYDYVLPEKIGALTDAPIIGDVETDDRGDEITDIHELYWYPSYETSDWREYLLEMGTVFFPTALNPEETIKSSMQVKASSFNFFLDPQKQSQMDALKEFLTWMQEGRIENDANDSDYNPEFIGQDVEDQLTGVSGEVNGKKTQDIYKELTQGLTPEQIEQCADAVGIDRIDNGWAYYDGDAYKTAVEEVKQEQKARKVKTSEDVVEADFNMYGDKVQNSELLRTVNNCIYQLAQADAHTFVDALKKERERFLSGVTASAVTSINDIDEDEDLESEHVPEEDDIYIEATGPLGSKLKVTQGGKFIGEFTEQEDADKAIKAWMEKSNFFPNIWQVSDHGNFHLYTLDEE